MEEKNRTKSLISITCVIIITAIVGVTAAGAGYSVLSGDDFTHGVRVGAFHVSLPEYFAASLLYVKDLYTDWQGTFFAMFLQAFLSPINNFGLPQLRAVMVVNVLLFFGALLVLLWVGLSFFRADADCLPGEVLSEEKRLVSFRLVLLTVFVATIANADVYAEIWFWFSGAVAYSIPFSVLLVALSLFLLINKGEVKPRRKTGYAAAAGILFFLSSGGTLMVAGIGCYTALILTGVFYLLTRKVSAHNLAVFAAGVIGALVNAAAPGNFARHDGTAGAGLHFGQAFRDTGRMFAEETGRLFKGTMLGPVFLLLIAAGLYLAGKCRIALREYGVVTALALAAGMAAYFPVALGYGDYYVPNRCYFIIDTALVISLLNLALFAGICLHKIWGVPADARNIAVFFYVCLAVLIVSPLTLSEMPLYKVARSVHNGSYRDYYGECVKIYDYLETCPEKDVVIDVPAYIENFECFYLDEDVNGWVNAGVAQFYHKNSVKAKPQ